MGELRNCTYRVEERDGKHIMVIEVDLDRDIGPSSTQKTILVCSSGGPSPVKGFPGFSWALNIFKKLDKDKP